MARHLAAQCWWLAGATAAILLALMPLYVGGYTISLLIILFANIALATAWSFFSGATGYISLATAAFFGLGVYITAILHTHTPVALALLAATASGFLVALLVGLSTLRLRGVYFVVFSFGLTELMQQAFAWWEITQNHTLSRYISVNVSSTVVFEILLAVALLTVLGSWYVSRTRLGYALRCIGADETVARHTGIDTTRIKVFVFAVSASVMTLVGAVLALRYRYVDPAVAFNNVWSFQVLVAALLGGPSRPWGPMVGAVPLILLSDYLAGTFPHHFGIALGLCFVVIVYFLAGGIAPLMERLYDNLMSGQLSVSSLADRTTALAEWWFPGRTWRRVLSSSTPDLMTMLMERGHRSWGWVRALAASLRAHLAQSIERYHRGWSRRRRLLSPLPRRMAPLLERCHRGWSRSRGLVSSLPSRIAPLMESYRRYSGSSRAFISSLLDWIGPLAAHYRQCIQRRLLPTVKRQAPADPALQGHRDQTDELHKR